MSSDNFYAGLEMCTSFLDVARPSAFVATPQDWQIVVTDIRGSTEAIREERYKEVNLVGASSIIALLNLDRGLDLPFAFGGDGAAVLIPPALVEAAKPVLLETRRMADEEFDLDLRLGLVPVTTITAAGRTVRVAKLHVSEHYHQALFRGGGLAYAESLVKDEATADEYAIGPAAQDDEADFSGLECRWQDIPSPHGETVTLLAEAVTGDEADDDEVYRRLIKTIEDVYDGDDSYRPVTFDALKPSFSLSRLMPEARLHSRPANWLKRQLYLLEIWGRNALLKYFVANEVETGSGVRWDRYVETLVATSDYRKYDDTLRMVIAGTTAQRKQLTAYLDEQYEAGDLVYGLHVTDRAMVTCVVFERMGQQVHFVDGADGGYALAAKALKQRRHHLSESRPSDSG